MLNNTYSLYDNIATKGKSSRVKDVLIVDDIDDLYGYFELNITDEGILFEIETIFVFVLKYSFKLYVGCFAEYFFKKLLANGWTPRFKKI